MRPRTPQGDAPDRIVYTDHWLRRDGYAPRQVWDRAHAGVASAGAVSPD